MKHLKADIVIIGAGLTGLTIAYFLRESGLSVIIVEARSRIGGRIHTLEYQDMPTMEMGATWLGNKHTSLVTLLANLGISIIEQEMGSTAVYEAISTSPPQIVNLPPNNEPTYRIKGGSSTLIKTLKGKLNPDTTILTDTKVKAIAIGEDEITIKSTSNHITSAKVITTLPPNLLVNTIEFEPSLPLNLEELMKGTHTWMGESIKIGLYYAHPFWKEGNLSGTIVSNVGPIPEMYDHSTDDKNQYALKGFLNGTYYSLTKEERLAKILGQLKKYYGNQANDYLKYEEKVWTLDPFTYVSYPQHVLPHQNNGHENYRRAYFENKLYIAGAETAAAYPGYMEGAVRSAKYIADKLLSTN